MIPKHDLDVDINFTLISGLDINFVLTLIFHGDFQNSGQKIEKLENSTKNSVSDAEICATTRKNEINVTDLICRSVYSSFKELLRLHDSFGRIDP